MNGKSALFFCSGSFDIDPKYNQAAREIVRAACLHGYDIVSGGTTKGTMKVVVDTARECGARAIGVLPRFMVNVAHPDLDEVIWTDSMSERKDKMRENASLAVALPGGAGTMDEFFDTLTLKKLGQYDGRLIVVNIDGFYDKLRELLGHFVETGMLDGGSMELVEFADSVGDFEKMI